MRTELPVLTDTQKKMVEEFQCPGCAVGCDVDECGNFELVSLKQDSGTLFYCKGHTPGTSMFGAGLPLTRIILGMPRGFCRIYGKGESDTKVRLWANRDNPGWDKFNIAVWAMEKDGYLFVRTYLPRSDRTYIDVIEGGTLDLCPSAVNVAEFYEDMD